MRNYNIVFKNPHTKDVFCKHLKENFIQFEASGYYDRGYYVAVICTPGTADELNNYLDTLLELDTEF